MGMLCTRHHWRSLRSRHIVGRNVTCDLVLPEPFVSGVHAELRHFESWTVRDLGSRNGTFVNGTRITQEAPLAAGDRIGFGDPDACWTLREADPPLPFAVSVERPSREVRGTPSTLALPDPSVCVLFLSLERNEWLAESGERARFVCDREVVDAAGLWTLHLPCPQVGTQPTLSVVTLAEARLRVLTSADLEHIEVAVSHRGGTFRLQHAAPHELLYVLALARQEGDGWVAFEDLAKRLSLDPTLERDRNRLRTWMHRLRQRFDGVGICDGSHILERRKGTREVRLGTRAVRIDPLPART